MPPTEVPVLPYSRQSVSEADVAAVAETLRGDWLTQGPAVSRFEGALAEATEAPYCVAVSSGTAALHLAYASLGLAHGDELITSPITFSATANAARLLGAEVVFADIEPDTGNISVASIADKITPRTRGITAIHYGGLPAELDAIAELATSRGLWLVEDASHALGARFGDTPIGSCAYSDATIFSTHAIKNVTTGEGGAICTRRPEVSHAATLLRSHGIDKSLGDEPWSYDMVALGWNYRITDIQCALGLSQLRRLETWVARRHELAALYEVALKKRFGDIVRVQASREDRESGRHLFPVQIDFETLGVDRATLALGLRSRGVGTQVHYIPVHTLAYYRDRYGDISVPGAEAFYANQLSLPFFVEMGEDEVEFVTAELERQLLGSNSARRTPNGAAIANA